MIEDLLGNDTAEKVLLYLEQYGEGYASAIADTFEGVSTSMALAQLQRFEKAGLLVSESVGRTRLFRWNPRYRFRREVRALLRSVMEALPEQERRVYFQARRRPRRSGKPA